MTIPPISVGIGSLTPEVWGQMAYAANIAHEARGMSPNTVGVGLPELGGHWSLAGTFLAMITGYASMTAEDNRWAYCWTHFVPYVSSAGYFKVGNQPYPPSDGNTQDGEIVQPYGNLSGSALSSDHTVPTDGPPSFAAAYNLAEWSNTIDYANGIDMTDPSWPSGFEPLPLAEDAATDQDKRPLVVMHWTRYCYSDGGDYKSRVLFFFDRQNHFDGACPA